MAAAAKEIVAPDHIHMSAEERTYFGTVIDEFARSELTPHKIDMIAFLARTMAALNKAQDDGDESGIKTYATLVISFRRSLCLHGRIPGTQIERPKDVTRRRQLTKAIEADTPFVEDLLARAN